MYDYKISHFNLYLRQLLLILIFYIFIKSSVKFKMNLRLEMLKYFFLKKIQFRVSELCYVLNLQRHS